MRLALARGGGERDDRHAALGAGGAAQEVDRPADRAEVAPARDLGVDLAGQVDLEGGVDRDEAALRGEPLGVVRVAGVAQQQLRVVVGEAVEPLAADQHRGDGEAGVDRLGGVGDRAGLDQVERAVADRAAVEAEVAVAREGGEDRVGQGADPGLQGGSVLDQFADPARDLALDVARLARLHHQGRRRAGHEEVEVVGVEQARAGPRRVLVDFADHHPGALQRGREVLVGEAEAEAAFVVGGRDLKQDDVDRQPSRGEEARVVGVVDRQDLERPRRREPAVGAGRRVGEEGDDVGVLRLHGVAQVHPEEAAEGADRVAGGEQRRGQPARLRGRLAPDHGVARPDPVVGLEAAAARRCLRPSFSPVLVELSISY